jgi:hypothetical protein
MPSFGLRLRDFYNAWSGAVGISFVYVKDSWPVCINPSYRREPLSKMDMREDVSFDQCRAVTGCGWRGRLRMSIRSATGTG